jgi:hypothetical protein
LFSSPPLPPLLHIYRSLTLTACVLFSGSLFVWLVAGGWC